MTTLALSGIVTAQPAEDSQASSNGAAPPFDINSIDPETFQAVAARLPEGVEPEIDGVLDDEAWTLAPPSGDFIQREPLSDPRQRRKRSSASFTTTATSTSYSGFSTAIRTYLDIGERFNAEMGFIPRRDVRNAKGSAAWTPRPGWRGVRQLTIGGAVDYFENHAGLMESRNQSGRFRLEFQDSSYLQIGGDYDYDFVPFDWDIGGGVIPTGAYQWNTFRAIYSSNQSRPVSVGATVERGGYYSGRKQSYQFNLNFLFAKTLLVESNYTRNEVTLPEQPTFTTNTINTRISYSVSPDLYLKTFLQYNDGHSLANFNFLLWYIYRPGSDLYIVYNQGWDTDYFGPHDFHTRDRSLTVKLTYWLSR